MQIACSHKRPKFQKRIGLTGEPQGHKLMHFSFHNNGCHVCKVNRQLSVITDKNSQLLNTTLPPGRATMEYINTKNVPTRIGLAGQPRSQGRSC